MAKGIVTATQQRLDTLARTCADFPELGVEGADDLVRWLETEFGHADALDRWFPHGRGEKRIVPPRRMLHVLAGNLPVSGLQSLLVGLILGAHNIIKLPTELDGEAAVRHRLDAFWRALPERLAASVEFMTALQDEDFSQADAILVHGADETIAGLRRRVRWDQIFVGYGHKVSVTWITKKAAPSQEIINACAHDVAIYDQRGCLSPQTIFLESGSDGPAFCEKLASALANEIERLPDEKRGPAETARLRGERDRFAAMGARLFLPQDHSLAYTVTWRKEPEFVASRGGRVIHVRPAEASDLPNLLRGLRGKVSSVGIGGELTSVTRAVFLAMGVHRFCPVGQMQHPPVWWHHDGMPQLSSLVKWVDDELASNGS